MKISVCTLAHGREDHLRNLVRGLNRSHRPPCELVVAVMQDHRGELPETGFPVRQVMLGSGDIAVPGRDARNTAAEHANGELLVFLDVDCIPAPSLIEDYAAAAEANDGVLMGEVGYLPKGATASGDRLRSVRTVAVKHADRAGRRAGWWALRRLPLLLVAQFRAFGPTFRGRRFRPALCRLWRRRYRFRSDIAAHGLPLWWVRGARPITNITSTTCPRSITSTASSPMRRSLPTNGVNRPCSTGCARSA